MKLNHLRDVVAVADRGGLRAAARHLNLAQPALTRSLGEIERELGASLFERGARGATLTATGQAFVARARSILNKVRRAEEEVAQLNGGTGGRVSMALSIASHIALLPTVLPAFRPRYPAAQLRIVEGIYPTVEAGLRDGEIDFYVARPGAAWRPTWCRNCCSPTRGWSWAGPGTPWRASGRWQGSPRRSGRRHP